MSEFRVEEGYLQNQADKRLLATRDKTFSRILHYIIRLGCYWVFGAIFPL